MIFVGIKQTEVAKLPKEVKEILKPASQYLPIMGKYDELYLSFWYEIKGEENFSLVESDFTQSPEKFGIKVVNGEEVKVYTIDWINTFVPSKFGLVELLREKGISYFLVNDTLREKPKNRNFKTCEYFTMCEKVKKIHAKRNFVLKKSKPQKVKIDPWQLGFFRGLKDYDC